MKGRSMSSIDINFILDASGSMAHLSADTIGGFNGFIDTQRAEPGDAYITLTTFDDKHVERYAAWHINDVPRLDHNGYWGGHGGGTALLDAVGHAITTYAARPIKADKSVFVITTDGEENRSTECTLAGVKALIEKHQAEGWAFVFLGANDSAWQGRAMGSRSVGGYAPTSGGTAALYENTSANVAAMRASAAPAAAVAAGQNWDTN